jgi:sarcosine/dimethylglycine N-methyltransferase
MPVELVQDHYAHGNLLDRIDAFLKTRHIDPAHLSHRDLFVCDQMHGGGVKATRAHITRAGIGAGMKVLDIGCGIGGAARCLAAECGCSVTGIDLTQEFIDVARELTARCELSEHIEFFKADALDMPFEKNTFDHAWCHNVTMNIQDKARLISEIARVLKPGGRFSCSEYALGPSGEPFYPLPWASEPAQSFLVTPDAMRAAVEAGGFRIIEQLDINEANLTFQRQMRTRAQRGELLQSVNPLYFTLGDAFRECISNVGKSAATGRLIEQLIVTELLEVEG